jgi:hypothetical protein
MTRSTTTLAVAADYADALMTARRAKNWLFILLLLILLLQLAIFLLLRLNVIKLEDRAGLEVSASAATQPAETKSVSVEGVLRYVIPATDFMGLIFVVVLSVVLLVLVTIMLVGRLIGVSHVTSAFVWSVLLAVLLFPWQALLITHERYQTYNIAGEVSSPGEIPPQPAFKVPGVLYTWPEVYADYRFPNQPLVPYALLKWGRYIGFPVLAILVLFMVQGRSSRGLRFALGEADVHVDVHTPPDEPPL